MKPHRCFEGLGLLATRITRMLTTNSINGSHINIHKATKFLEFVRRKVVQKAVRQPCSKLRRPLQAGRTNKNRGAILGSHTKAQNILRSILRSRYFRKLPNCSTEVMLKKAGP